MNIKTCLNKGYLQKIRQDISLVNKELKEASYDIKKADQSFNDQDYKWTIVKCYYAMFHSAKALLFSIGYKERKHIAIIIVLEEQNKQGKLESKFVNYFKAALTAREDTDYHYSYSKETAEYELETAKELLIK